MKMFYTIVLILLFSTSSFATVNTEKYYQDKFCNNIGGQSEFYLSDQTRVDCLTKDSVYEVEFASKWAESIGQSLHYARMTNKKPGIVFIVEQISDMKYVTRLINVIISFNLGIEVIIVTP